MINWHKPIKPAVKAVAALSTAMLIHLNRAISLASLGSTSKLESWNTAVVFHAFEDTRKFHRPKRQTRLLKLSDTQAMS